MLLSSRHFVREILHKMSPYCLLYREVVINMIHLPYIRLTL
jgi:hypothetical protein